MHIENNRDHFINLCAYCQCCTIVVAVNVTVYVNVTRFPGSFLRFPDQCGLSDVMYICRILASDRQIAGEIHCGLHL